MDWRDAHWPAAFGLSLLVVWRLVWLSAGVPDVTTEADRVREEALTMVANAPVANVAGANSYRVAFANLPNDRSQSVCRVIQEEIWDSELPIWITPGADGMPGWAGWDDNQNGEIDESIELGAAWSDDSCVIETDDRRDSPQGRIIDRGAYRPTEENELPTRLRLIWGPDVSPPNPVD